jgi:aminoglycoside phosphotransferase (APT) family kinase protein
MASPDEREALRGRIAAHLERETRGPVRVIALEPLAGGACQDNWRVDVELGGVQRRLVLRSDARGSIPGSIGRRVEQKVVNAAARAGVRTPEARWLAEGLVRDGAFAYFLDWVRGEAIGRRVVKSPELEAARRTLPDELAVELARIHSIAPATAPDLFVGGGRDLDEDSDAIDPARNLIQSMRAMLDRHGAPRPALELALRWLEDHLPAKSEVTLVHGDFRVGNFLVAPEGLQAVLDWEFSRWGTPAEDLAWLCVRDWRFGRLDRPVGGIGLRAPFYAAYEKASGRRVDPREVRFWEVVGNVRWAIGSLHQGRRYTEGEHDLELIAVARRASEMEWEALRLVDAGGV